MMLPTRQATRRRFAESTYVCLSCRLQSNNYSVQPLTQGTVHGRKDANHQPQHAGSSSTPNERENHFTFHKHVVRSSTSNEFKNDRTHKNFHPKKVRASYLHNHDHVFRKTQTNLAPVDDGGRYKLSGILTDADGRSVGTIRKAPRLPVEHAGRREFRLRLHGSEEKPWAQVQGEPRRASAQHLGWLQQQKAGTGEEVDTFEEQKVDASEPVRRYKVGIARQWGTPWPEKKEDVRQSEELDEVFVRHVEKSEGQDDRSVGKEVEGTKDSFDTYLVDDQSTRPIEGGVAPRRNESGRDRDGSTPFNPFLYPTPKLSSKRYIPLASSNNISIRQFHSSIRIGQQAAAAAQEEALELLPQRSQSSKDSTSATKHSAIRTQLRQWQALHGTPNDTEHELDFDRDSETDAANALTRLPDTDSTSFRRREVDEAEEEERHALSTYMQSPKQDLDPSAIDTRFLQTGDLVELEFPKSERESIIAVFVRRLGFESQFFTMHGRWVHVPERHIQYSIPGWVHKKLVEPLLQHLPSPETPAEYEELREVSYMQDLSVPRSIAAPLVSRMVQFHTEALEIYRKYAGTLDSAHEILAHATDLRYGSLMSATTTLLKMPAEKLPVTALFTVRKALARAGFAFNIDRRSHRLTGYLQIRSKEQVKMVEQVRGWIRDWQDDLAKTAAMDQKALRKHKTLKTAQYLYDFIEKAKTIIARSRENRDATQSGNVGPSKKRFPITVDSDSVRQQRDTQFTNEDTELVRFLEAWCCSNMFMDLPRIAALPPLILQATGYYEEMNKTLPTGFMFLQELGTVMPYENRVRFDQHLLLPSSQHSKPLQNLMNSLLEMEGKHNFQDSMKDIRHDWGDLSVYCIDDASAHEIDDGISITTAGEGQWWVHIHIANPTAFFERDHPLAKMARHMGESIYMPERTYMMLPRWATLKHFSLGKERPCLTFSARINRDGEVLDRNIRSGFIRNVMRLTGAEVSEMLGHGGAGEGPKETVLTVGGERPPRRAPKNGKQSPTPAQLEELRTLQELAEKRQGIRNGNGGLFFSMHKPEVEVWQGYNSTGLSWDHPYRKGSRTIEGDPVIQMRTKGLQNWFAPQRSAVDTMVTEMMLLACEIAAKWCSDRQVPAMFRGTIQRPNKPDPDQYLRDVLEPASGDGQYPMHLAIVYLQTLGATKLSTTPLKHRTLGMEHYGKVTSPLRRYGDMILHWQIEAALKEEARTGKSLVTKGRKVDRSFLPFSSNVLDTIILGLQPREYIISRAKLYAEGFWIGMLLFRAFHYNEAELPFSTPAHRTFSDGSPKPLLRCFVHSAQSTTVTEIPTMNIDLNINAAMLRPGMYGLGEPKMGDVWECEMERIDVYRRIMVTRPVRLLERPDQAAEILMRRGGALM